MSKSAINALTKAQDIMAAAGVNVNLVGYVTDSNVRKNWRNADAVSRYIDSNLDDWNQKSFAQREFDIVQRADGIQYACINEQAVFFRAHRSGTWVRTSVKPELEYFTPAGTERLTDVDTSAPIFTGHNLSEISEYFRK